MAEPDFPEALAPDVGELRADLGFERRQLTASVRHDFSTSETGVVPLDRRRPMWHFMCLWTTFVAGFGIMFLGFQIHAGHSLISTVEITVLGYTLYVSYAIGASYLGSRTGQTHALLTRSVFGRVGSWMVSAFVLIAPLGWVAFLAKLLVDLWAGFYGWRHVFILTLLMAGLMVINNVLGFTGISVFARYLVAPLLIIWSIYLVAKVVISDGNHLGGTPAGNGLPFWVAVVAVIGFAVWGNEPDVWRYGQPRLFWPLPTYLFAGIWFLLFVTAGWMMAELSRASASPAIFRYTVHYSLFGLFWLAGIIATVSQFAGNDANYYESINAGQNLIGGWRCWRREYTCLLVAGGGVIAADVVNFHFMNGWLKVATFLATTVPCATVIMAVDHFLLPRLFAISRPLVRVPNWADAGTVNIPAVIALLGAVFFGVTGAASWPSGWIYSSPPNGWGPVPLESWLIAGLLYILLVAVARAVVPNVKSTLAFSRDALTADVSPTAVVDIASD